MDIEAHADTRAYFHERLERALTRLDLSVSADARFYLLELLAQQVGRAPSPDEPIVTRLASAYAATGLQERFDRFRDAGDVALHGCGFFAERFERRGVSRDYVVEMGARAYYQAKLEGQRLRRPTAEVFSELAAGFDGLACALGEVREETTLRTPQDIVRLLDRYRRTHSPLLAQRLEAEGVFPQLTSAPGTLH